jgi:L-ascorbate metabolism protein UlaG (beta-lactamase superfamily)
MRLKLGRPDLGAYADRFDVPEAGSSSLSVTFLGVSSLLIDDGRSAILTDGFFTRPSMARVLLGRIGPDLTRIEQCLQRAGIHRLEAVLPAHSHFDHVMDSAAVAELAGALLVGGESTANVGRGRDLREDRLVVATPGAPLTLGAYTVTLVESEHCPPDRYPGVIEEPLRPPAKAGAYRCGEAWSILVTHDSGRTALVQGSAGFVRGALSGEEADVVYLGVGQLGIQTAEYIETYWTETVRAVGARRAVLTHWDDFFRPLPLSPEMPPLRALPYAGDDLDATMRVLTRLAEQDGVVLSFPTVWRREDPWAQRSEHPTTA